ncbi:hypothetical protein NE865_16266 [Phthorimaea operculella]|nr:hypothetical protein NE865_16266 [Phthorimaea operculella]
MHSFKEYERINSEIDPADEEEPSETESVYYSCLNHKLHVCPKFLLAPVAERLDFVKKNRLCKICLGGHQGRCKYYFKCQECKQGTHNTLLHSPVINSQAQAQVKEEKKNVSLLSNTNIGYKFQTLMPTAKVKIVGKNGKEFVVRALLDSASDTSFITSNLAKKLGKPLMPNSTDVIGIAKTGKEVKYSIPTLDVFSCVYPYKAQVSNCLVVDGITTKLPHNELDLRKVLIPKNIQLADDSFHIPGEIDLLLPSGIYYRVLLPQPLDLQFGQGINTGRPAFVHTQFGYVVGGDAPISSSNNDAAVALFCHDCNTSTNDDIVSQFSPSHNSSHHFDEESSRDLPKDLPELKATKPNFSEVVCAVSQTQDREEWRNPVSEAKIHPGSLSQRSKEYILLIGFERKHELYLSIWNLKPPAHEESTTTTSTMPIPVHAEARILCIQQHTIHGFKALFTNHTRETRGDQANVEILWSTARLNQD